MNRVAAQSIGVKGFFKFEVFKGVDVLDENGEWTGEVIEIDGSRRTLADNVPNQILDAGRNKMGSSDNWAGDNSYCQVGTNSAAPTSVDTQLLGYVAGTNTKVAGAAASGAASSEPWYAWDQQTYRFGSGVAEGNLSEAGVGWNATDGPYLVTRALIVDEDGIPFTPTVLDDEYLDVTYQLRYYPPLEDIEGTIILDGITYDTITRASGVNSGGGNIGQMMGVWDTGTNYWKAYDGDIGEIFEAPDGLHDDADTSAQFNLGYQNNSYYRDMQINCGITGWNNALGIRSILINTNAGQFQTQFNAQGTGDRIPKDIDYYMSFVWRLTWAGWYWANTYNRQASSDSTTPTTGNWNTNVAETLLRINWDDTGATDHQDDLQLEDNTLFRITQNSDPTKWVHYRSSAAYTEDVDYTYYTVSVEDSQNSGPDVGQDCTITAVDS